MSRSRTVITCIHAGWVYKQDHCWFNIWGQFGGKSCWFTAAGNNYTPSVYTNCIKLWKDQTCLACALHRLTQHPQRHVHARLSISGFWRRLHTGSKNHHARSFLGLDDLLFVFLAAVIFVVFPRIRIILIIIKIIIILLLLLLLSLLNIWHGYTVVLRGERGVIFSLSLLINLHQLSFTFFSFRWDLWVPGAQRPRQFWFSSVRSRGVGPLHRRGPCSLQRAAGLREPEGAQLHHPGLWLRRGSWWHQQQEITQVREIQLYENRAFRGRCYFVLFFSMTSPNLRFFFHGALIRLSFSLSQGHGACACERRKRVLPGVCRAPLRGISPRRSSFWSHRARGGSGCRLLASVQPDLLLRHHHAQRPICNRQRWWDNVWCSLYFRHVKLYFTICLIASHWYHWNL